MSISIRCVLIKLTRINVCRESPTATEIKIRDLLRLNEGSVVELDRLAGDPLDILANGTTIAKGEVVMVGERFGIRFTEVADPEERVQNL